MELEDAFTDQFVSFSSDADNRVDCRDVAKDRFNSVKVS